MEPAMKQRHALIFAALLLLSACGANKTDRAVGGALVGAGTGALIGSTVGAPGYGAAIGAGVGAGVGAMTEMETINLGKPWWK
jgi:osmotically inducible lipoprotein OsmB